MAWRRRRARNERWEEPSFPARFRIARALPERPRSLSSDDVNMPRIYASLLIGYSINIGLLKPITSMAVKFQVSCQNIFQIR